LESRGQGGGFGVATELRDAIRSEARRHGLVEDAARKRTDVRLLAGLELADREEHSLLWRRKTA
jgi:hypothetical protein